MDRLWDEVIVGAGTAGAPLAARLSERPDRQVLLIEAGPDFPDAERLPEELKNAHSAVTEGYNWDFQAHIRSTGLLDQLVGSVGVLAASGMSDMLSAAKAAMKSIGTASQAIQQQTYFNGRVTGGTSSVNGAVALRAHPEDFERWVAAGNDEWTWESVLPFYKKLEADQDFQGPVHGADGPVPITRPTAGELHPLQAAFIESCRAAGLPDLADFNGSSDAGVGIGPSNSVHHQRLSTALTYLRPARGRSNLTILPSCMVERVVVEGKRAVGLEVRLGGESRRIAGKRITLSGGVMNTPALLLRSGIGDARLCKSLGVTSVHPLPGVGENLIEHPTVLIWMVPKPGVCRAGEPYHQALARFSSRGSSRRDLYLFMLSNMITAKIPLLGSLLHSPLASAISVMLAQPEARGRVFLERADVDARPVIELNVAGAQRDVERLKDGVRQAWKVIKGAPLAERTQSVFMWNDAMVKSDDLTGRAISRFVNGSWHAVGTSKMGPKEDPMAVVDQHCRVHGIERLRIVDASVMPDIPSVPTGLTCMMLGERLADWMSREED
jgi:choline dehydrogenase